jgi:gliding motility-associated-like protein
LNESGWYGVYGSYDYGEVSCPFYKSIYIDEKAPPLIIMDPVDGIVCPGDSVLLSLTQTGISYEWIGPEGDLVSTDSATYVVDQGFYACIFTDEDGCQLLTAQAEIKEYITPFIELSPTNVICDIELITLTAIHGGLAAVLWHSPINSTQETVVVNQPGTYSCEVTQCGITVLDSITIIDGSFTVDLTAESTNLCFGDTVRINASPGLSFYEWSNGILGSPYLDVTNSGSFSVIAYNQYGCADTSNVITINIFPESFPPAVNDTFVCVGGDISLNYQSEFGFGWYNSPSDVSPFSTQNTISYTGIMNDFPVFIAHNSVNCPLSFTEVNIEVLFPLTPPEIIGDTTICVFQDVNFSVNPITNGHYFWVYDGDTLSNTNTLVINNITTIDPTLVQIFMNDGCTATQNQIEFTLKFPSPIDLDKFADTLCYGENLLVNASGTGNLHYFWTDGTTTWSNSNLNVSYFDIASNQIHVYGINADDCHSDTLQVDVTLSPDANLNVQLDNLSCLNAELTISADNSLGTLFWQFPTGDIVTTPTIYFSAIQFSDQGHYIAQLYNQFSCLISDTIEINVHELPKFTGISDSILCEENVYDLTLPNQNYTYLWNNISSDINFTPNGIDPIILIAIDSIGCSFSDTISILLVDCSGQAANVITTNNDGINDYFTVFNSEYSYNNCIVILNRWGNVVYEKNYYRNDFNGYTNDGKKLNDGVYFYLYYKDCSLKREITHQGYLHIISK